MNEFDLYCKPGEYIRLLEKNTSKGRRCSENSSKENIVGFIHIIAQYARKYNLTILYT
ncbi:MAG: hypothetical protein APG12_00543 [Candidatus Methanofastidiosum methylothiophilum]|uniref:Uncharacterized protein n=1 Tax=Candidatus Methanofastidiosum methylothiophilum TaxID=1705564 RepID=A0A150IM06_9EURY|nr:MAG: hypothetical protein APG10_00452 [Candidatus Methanofastidiosum methylthiophilus]KYC48201.1 MAG: hypothetical protein APG11_00562 [Candidatus Methanofastidiosum methylthiophilus]KYC50856.1 MAG: hypothetical protein APG12_00543 [Candidatus Methanofastidiosum methylthiophilus]